MKNATQTKTNKNAKTLVSNATKLIEKIDGQLVVNEQLTGKKLERILTPFQASKKDLKTAVNEKRNSLSYNLKLIKDDCKKESNEYLKQLAEKFGIEINSKELYLLLSTPANFIPFLTDSQKEKFEDKRLNFTPSVIIEAISKYYKNTAKNSL